MKVETYETWRIMVTYVVSTTIGLMVAVAGLLIAECRHGRQELQEFEEHVARLNRQLEQLSREFERLRNQKPWNRRHTTLSKINMSLATINTVSSYSMSARPRLLSQSSEPSEGVQSGTQGGLPSKVVFCIPDDDQQSESYFSATSEQSAKD